MFVVRRIHHAKRGQARKLADVLTRIGEMYQASGDREPSRVYISGGSVPGPIDTVYVEWLEEALRSPYRKDLVAPPQEDKLFEELKQYEDGPSAIEFYELYSGE